MVTQRESYTDFRSAQTLTNFYVSKVDDFDLLAPTLESLAVLSKLPTFDHDAAVLVYRQLASICWPYMSG